MTSALLVALGVAAASCLGGETPRPLGFRCQSDYECSGALVCQYGRCRSECTYNSDCPGDAICVPRQDSPDQRVCTLVTEEGCDDEDPERRCPEGLRCSPIDNQCRVPCQDDRCPDDYTCIVDASGEQWCVQPGFGDCGDSYCVIPEDPHRCPGDCPAICGDGLCTHDEDAGSCIEDCDSPCGDAICGREETAVTCPVDCPADCGDGACTHLETYESCPADCPNGCGNSDCDSEETAESCPVDCPADCGDGACTHLETYESCSSDCPDRCGNSNCGPEETAESCGADCPADCGDGFCTHSETPSSCPDDCLPECGDGFCTHSESYDSCPADCVVGCGNGDCDSDETASNCPGDCEALCPDGVCTHAETPLSCANDCLAVCPDPYCSHAETAFSCPSDCPPECDDGECTHSETVLSCPSDCPDECGDSLCTGAEAAVSCPGDCLPECGDGECTHSETLGSCPSDCVECGDGVCSEQYETADLCSADCNAVLSMSTGGFFSCALIEGGTVRCWGLGNMGQLGNGLDQFIGDDEALLGDVDLGGALVADVACGLAHTCAILTTGEVLCWGHSGHGRLGEGSETIPLVVESGEVPGDDPGYGNDEAEQLSAMPRVDLGGLSAVQLALGDYHSCALLVDGTVRCWGAGPFGQLGDGITAGDHTVSTPVEVIGLTGVEAITAGAHYTCAVLESGEARCWGDGILGQLGDGFTTGSSTPVTVSGLNDAIAIEAGTTHACAVDGSDALYCWGAGDLGRLGTQTPDNQLTPVMVSTDTTVVSAGQYHTCGVSSLGDVRCWGYGADGRLGNLCEGGSCLDYSLGGSAGFEVDTVSAIDVAPGISVNSVIAGHDFSCALLATGRVRCWGAASVGQLGYGNSNIIGDDEPPSSAGDVPIVP